MDKKSVAHTVAIPRPRDYVARKFLARLRRDRAELDGQYLVALEDRSIADFAAVKKQFSRRKLRQRSLPDDVKIGKGCADPGVPIRDAVVNAIDRLPVEWRLDAVLVLEDILDDWDS